MIDLVNNKYQVFDNLVSKETQDFIESVLLDGDNFPWFFNDTSCKLDEEDQGMPFYDYMQFSHSFVLDYKENSTAKGLVLDKLLREVNIKNEVIRAKANLKPIAPMGDLDKHNKPHYDQKEDHFVGLYYVNESDGDTWLFNEDKTMLARIKPRKGRLLVFDGNLLHAASHPYYAKKRLVINIDFKK